MRIELELGGEPSPLAIEKAAVRWSGTAGMGLEYLASLLFEIEPPDVDLTSHRRMVLWIGR